MADIVTLTKVAAQAILNKSVVSGTINAQGHLILTKYDGSTIDAGDFTAIVTGILNQSVATAVNTAVPAAVAGLAINKGNITGAITFTEFNKDTLVNATITGTLTGNISIDAAALPANPRAGTQFAFRMTQDATGSRTLTLTGFKKSMGTLVLTTTAAAIDIVVFYYDGTQWYAGMMGVDFR